MAYTWNTHSWYHNDSFVHQNIANNKYKFVSHKHNPLHSCSWKHNNGHNKASPKSPLFLLRSTTTMLPSAFLSIPLYYTPRSIRFSSSSNGACLFCSLASPCRYRSNLFVARSQRCCRPASNLSLLISSSSSQEASENNDNAADKQHNDEESSSTPEESPDILQSPSFLKRKLEVGVFVCIYATR